MNKKPESEAELMELFQNWKDNPPTPKGEKKPARKTAKKRVTKKTTKKSEPEQEETALS